MSLSIEPEGEKADSFLTIDSLLSTIRTVLKTNFDGAVKITAERRKDRQQIFDFLLNLQKEAHVVFYFEEETKSKTVEGALIGAAVPAAVMGVGGLITAGLCTFTQTAGGGIMVSTACGMSIVELAPLVIGGTTIPVVGWVIGGALLVCMAGGIIGAIIGSRRRKTIVKCYKVKPSKDERSMIVTRFFPERA